MGFSESASVDKQILINYLACFFLWICKLINIYIIPTLFCRRLDFSKDPFFLNCSRNWLTDDAKKSRRIIGVRNQQNTNGCYAFAIVTATAAAAEGGEACRYSEQELLDRVHLISPQPEPQNIPDEGLPNTFENGFEYVKSHGIYLEKDYKWVGRFQRELPKNLPLNPEKIYITGYKRIADMDHSRIVQQLRKQPLVGGIITSKRFDSWGFEDKIYEGPNSEEMEEMNNEMEEALKKGNTYGTRNHAVTLVGYGGVEGSNDYYLCQNSYGSKWGHHGYFKVRRDAVFCVYYPVGVHKKRKIPTTYQDLVLKLKSRTQVPCQWIEWLLF